MRSRPRPSEQACLQAPPPPAGLRWEPLDLQSADIGSLVAGCAGVDQEVPPVAHIHGGAREGNARWEAFRRSGLDQYASRRNNAMLRCGYNMVSVFMSVALVLPTSVMAVHFWKPR